MIFTTWYLKGSMTIQSSGSLNSARKLQIDLKLQKLMFFRMLFTSNCPEKKSLSTLH